jgi:hypothetical protein
MPGWKEGDRVTVVTREVTKTDKEQSAYFSHMAGLTGTVTNVYESGEVAILVDNETLPEISREVHKTATDRIRTKFAENSTEEQRKALTAEQMKFPVNFVLLVKEGDLIKS